jgi:hypothetical protein
MTCAATLVSRGLKSCATLVSDFTHEALGDHLRLTKRVKTSLLFMKVTLSQPKRNWTRAYADVDRGLP